jgi:orotidine-5'-phosphate decarboxylase
MPATPSTAKEKIIVALDAPDADSAKRLADPLLGEGCLFKIGLQLFTAEGPSIVRDFKTLGARVFLDLKFHDIPNTATEAVRSATALGAEMTTIHLCGGPRMVAESVATAKNSGLLILGVTVLTSMDAESLHATGVPDSPKDQVVRLAAMGVACGLRGVVASPHEIRPLRERFGNDLVIVTPGVRPAGSEAGDQKRVMTPSDAIRAGADYLVIGRPITSAPSPLDALRAIAGEIDPAIPR